MRFSSKHVLVTGAATGVGRTIGSFAEADGPQAT